MRSEQAAGARTKVVVLVPEDEEMPPGLDPVTELADVHLARTDAELSEVIGEADILCVWDFRRPRLARFWPEASNLKWVHASSAGVDAVLFDELVRSDVLVTNTRGVLDDSIAEYVLGAILAFTKDLPTSIRLQQKGKWRHRDTERSAGRRVLVLGAGSIGRSVGRLCRCAGMVVEGLGSRSRPGDDVFEGVVGPDGLDEALGRAEFAVACLPLTAETRGMIGADQFAAMPPGSRFINVARGPVVDEDALVRALDSGHLAGAALDVFVQEPLPAGHPFWEMEQVIVTAHQAGDFVGWEEAFSAVFVENFRRFERGEQLNNVVDKERMLPPGSES
ncbi:MAG: D-2-hydroxyacid dehydrogenase [Actinobacteria bacterium]|nr:D-2-hydroxyacid dehydrogenase [Actinomycetota bacterium]